MTPNIRVDDEVYDLLKTNAEAFVDTPNSVLRRLLGLTQREKAAQTDDQLEARHRPVRRKRRARTKGRTRAPKGSLLAEDAYVRPLLSALVQRGGSAPVGDIIDALGKQLNGEFTAMDRETLPSGQLRWKNRAQFVRLRLVNEGFLADDSPRGVWTITELGRSQLNGTSA
jgi:hypothetical protein